MIFNFDSKMIKLMVFNCAMFILVQNASSSSDQFGSFWGPCPEKPKNITTSSRSLYNNVTGEWYIHRVLGKFSPWKIFDCQTDNIVVDAEYKTVNVTSQFKIPVMEIPVQWNGTVQAINATIGKLDILFKTNDGTLSQSTIFLRTYRDGEAALLWKCLDFELYHIESIQVLTRYQDPNDPRIDSSVFKNINDTLIQSGISPSWFQEISQNNCDFSSPSSSDFSSLVVLLAGGWESPVPQDLWKRVLPTK